MSRHRHVAQMLKEYDDFYSEEEEEEENDDNDEQDMEMEIDKEEFNLLNYFSTRQQTMHANRSFLPRLSSSFSDSTTTTTTRTRTAAEVVLEQENSSKFGQRIILDKRGGQKKGIKIVSTPSSPQIVGEEISGSSQAIRPTELKKSISVSSSNSTGKSRIIEFDSTSTSRLLSDKSNNDKPKLLLKQSPESSSDYVAKPSAFAMNLESRLENLTIGNNTNNSYSVSDLSLPSSKFQFDSPSPDDLVRMAQKSRGNLQKRTEPVATLQPIVLGSTVPSIRIDSTKLEPKKDDSNVIITSSETLESLGRKPLLNLVVVGHVDAGKSTLMGHFLYKLGHVSKKDMHKFEKESKEMGKASFHFAWVMDEHAEERERGITMDVGMNKFDTESKRIALLDAPGHKDYIPKMISGAAQADAAILVVPASTGEFESSFLQHAQTREHAILVRYLGVSQIIVAVNKMDLVNWSETRFHEVSHIVEDFLVKTAGFEKDDITFIPVSGLLGTNLLDGDGLEWFKGPSLMRGIDSFSTKNRPVSKPLRLVVSDVYKSMNLGFTIGGKIEAGTISVGDKVLLAPSMDIVGIKGIMLHGDVMVKKAIAGENVEVGVTGIDELQLVTMGSILCSTSNPVKISSLIECHIIALDAITVPILNGAKMLLHLQSVEVPIVIQKILRTFDPQTSKHKENAICVRRNETADVRISVTRPICVERFEDFRPLGRFFLRRNGITIAYGMIKDCG